MSTSVLEEFHFVKPEIADQMERSSPTIVGNKLTLKQAGLLDVFREHAVSSSVKGGNFENGVRTSCIALAPQQTLPVPHVLEEFLRRVNIFATVYTGSQKPSRAAHILASLQNTPFVIKDGMSVSAAAADGAPVRILEANAIGVDQVFFVRPVPAPV